MNSSVDTESLQKLIEECRNAYEQVKTSQIEYVNLKSRLDEKEEECASLAQLIAKKDNELEELRKTEQEMNECISHLRQEIQRYIDLRSAVEQQLGMVSCVITRDPEPVENSDTGTQGADINHVIDLEQRISELERQNADLSGSYTYLSTENARLVEENRALQREIAGHEQTVESLRYELLSNQNYMATREQQLKAEHAAQIQQLKESYLNGLR